MNIFEAAQTHTRQGDIGEAQAILEYTKLGYQVSRTLFDSAKYDLIIDDGEKLQRVQVRTSTFKKPCSKNAWRWAVGLKQTGGNTRVNTIRHRQDNDYDILFVVVADGRCWSIPVGALGDTRSEVNLGGPRYAKYEIT